MLLRMPHEVIEILPYSGCFPLEHCLQRGVLNSLAETRVPSNPREGKEGKLGSRGPSLFAHLSAYLVGLFYFFETEKAERER